MPRPIVCVSIDCLQFSLSSIVAEINTFLGSSACWALLYARIGEVFEKDAEAFMKISHGWLNTAQQLPSPNCDSRPSAEISLIVVHGISLPAGHFGNSYVNDLFLNQLNLDAHPDFADLQSVCVSSHLLIRRDGRLLQYVPFHQRAWHAGISSFKGRSSCNDFSVGIELEGTDEAGYNANQYLQLASVCRLMLDTWQIPADHIVGHCDIAPGRKTDPGPAFKWAEFHALLAATGSLRESLSS